MKKERPCGVLLPWTWKGQRDVLFVGLVQALWPRRGRPGSRAF